MQKPTAADETRLEMYQDAIAYLEAIWQLCPPKTNARCELSFVRRGYTNQPNQFWFFTDGAVRVEYYRMGVLWKVVLGQYNAAKWWALYPIKKEFDIIPFRPRRFVFNINEAGVDTHLGEKVDHIKAHSTNLAPLIFDLEIWRSSDGLPLRSRLAITKNCFGVDWTKLGGTSNQTTSEVLSIDRSPQPQELFEVPSDYAPFGLADKPIYNVGQLNIGSKIRSGRIMG